MVVYTAADEQSRIALDKLAAGQGTATPADSAARAPALR